jgi:hypothetical protein
MRVFQDDPKLNTATCKFDTVTHIKDKNISHRRLRLLEPFLKDFSSGVGITKLLLLSLILKEEKKRAAQL